MIITSVGPHYWTQATPTIAYNQSRWVPDDINYFHWLQSTMDTGEVATEPLNECVTDIEDDDHEYGTRSIECDHQPKHPQWIEWSYPWMSQYWKPKAKLRDDLWVSTVTTGILPIKQSAPISVCLYTYSSSNLEAHLQKHSMANLRLLIPTEEDLSRTKCTKGADTLRLMHSYRHERLDKPTNL